MLSNPIVLIDNLNCVRLRVESSFIVLSSYYRGLTPFSNVGALVCYRVETVVATPLFPNGRPPGADRQVGDWTFLTRICWLLHNM